MTYTSLVGLTYGLAILTCLSLWVKTYSIAKPWYILFGLTLISGFISGNINIIGFILIISLLGILINVKGKYSILNAILATILATLIAMHFTPGFDNLLIIHKLKLSNDSTPYTLYLNLDKLLVGILIIGIGQIFIKTPINITKTLKYLIIYYIPALICILGISYSLHYLKYEPKLPSFLPIWLLANLIFTVLAEEAIFRGLLLEKISSLNIPYATTLAIIISSISFGLIHYAGGINYILVAMVAGLFYSLIYVQTKRLEASILLHFAINLTHILLFTYPALVN